MSPHAQSAAELWLRVRLSDHGWRAMSVVRSDAVMSGVSVSALLAAVEQICQRHGEMIRLPPGNYIPLKAPVPVVNVLPRSWRAWNESAHLKHERRSGNDSQWSDGNAEAVRWLREQLSTEAWLDVRDVRARAMAAGISIYKVNAVSTDICEKRRYGHNGSLWRLKGGQP